ncbi:hypothetical protein [Acinetobacter sp. YH12120]|uniref:hypothetical protein n=1 Tax=Acinetobacter sp. YH12120 TaxID=2601107 RepID=UPI0015D33144|nr:hypothetical protein [Acinetobacter sp. YH12120]
MNLIEQIGGYGKAKEIAFDPLHPQMTHVSNDGRHWVNEEFSHIPEIQEQIPTMIRIKDIRKALLEYRRQHNIFEESDNIVFIDDFMHGDLMTVAWTRKGEVWMDEGAKRCTDLSMIRHATDAEIKAGKRLEVNQ